MERPARLETCLLSVERVNDPIISVTVWRGQLTALSARLGIAPSHLAALIKRRGARRGGHLEIEVSSPAAMRTLAHALRIADEEP